ncbi:MAG: hypothetical protein EBT02_18525 [Planctomycetia bacterium]|nr:hypothetical protein [Planctomycetia bacterium]
MRFFVLHCTYRADIHGSIYSMGASVLLFSSDVFLFFRGYIPFHAKSNRCIEKRNIRVKIKRP